MAAVPDLEIEDWVPPSEPVDGVLFFPVRHYSPASAIHLEAAILEMKPAAVLIEGPADFNEHLDELFLGHEFPIAIYSYVRFSNETKASAFYPFCEYSPEWVAAELGRDLGARVEFIDLAWDRMAEFSTRQHRYSDVHFRENPYPARLCQKLAVSDFDELWDVLFELEPELNWRTYLDRCHAFCTHVRLFSPPTDENERREAFMIDQIRRVRDEVDGPVVVVTGGFHSSGLWAGMRGRSLPWFEAESTVTAEDEPPTAEELLDEQLHDDDPEPIEIVEKGITLTPFTYPRIDKLSGYASGLHGPAYYEHVWRERRSGDAVDSTPILEKIIERIRERGQLASTADVIALRTTARTLARLRGRREIWRFDILDALSASLIKEAQDSEYIHPILLEARKVMTGQRRGFIAEGASLPPLVRNAMKTFRDLDLEPGDRARTISLNLEDPADRERSRVLHQCQALGIAGFHFQDGTNFVQRDGLSEPYEDWLVGWSPEFDGTLIEASVYGSDLAEAATHRALERARAIERDAVEAAKLAIDLMLMGLDDLADSVLDSLRDAIVSDSDFFSVSKALGHVLYLFGYDEVLGSANSDVIAKLLEETYRRCLWLLESLGNVGDRAARLVEGVRCIFDTFRLRAIDEDRTEFSELFGRVGTETTQSPVTRGAAMGVLYTLDDLGIEAVLEAVKAFRDPVDLGDFLLGFFSLAREAAQRDARLMALLDEIVSRVELAEFFEMLPGLRLAFTFFTPLEKHKLVDLLFHESEPTGAGAAPAGPKNPEDAADLEQRVSTAIRCYGLRDGSDPSLPDGSDSSLPDKDSPAQSATDEERGESSDAPSALETPGAQTEAAEFGERVDEAERGRRWRLIMGRGTEGSGIDNLTGEWAQRERMMGFLYDREYGPGRNVRGGKKRSGGLGESTLSVPDWINGIHELFPRRTIERLEKDALDRYQLEEIVTRPDVLRRTEPNMTLLKAVLRTKHLMNKEVLEIARNVVRRVVAELIEKLAREIRNPFVGARNRRRRSFIKVSNNFDPDETIRRNLKHYDHNLQKLVIQEPIFFSRVRRHVDRWQIIILVDQSGSMIESVIHAAVTASIFRGIHKMKSHLVAFDTNVVDLSADCVDPVETLMNVQLGGGTDIANALQYARTLVDNPRRTIVVLISDFFEGGPVPHLLDITRTLVEDGVELLGLAALDREANPTYDRDIAQKMVNLGASVGAMTPGELAEWIARRVG